MQEASFAAREEEIDEALEDGPVGRFTGSL
jgi:hypothetical protein